MTYETSERDERAVVVEIEHKRARRDFPNAGDVYYDPEEISQLTETAGAVVLEKTRISIGRVDPGYYVGKGKAAEIAEIAAGQEANLVVFDCALSPSQQTKLEEAVGVRIIDRTQVILDIFAQRARTNEGKLQVELAQLNYLLPRLRGRGAEMSRLGAGIGTRGPGEMKLETDRRRIKTRIARLNLEITGIRRHRSLLRKERKKLVNIAVAGYTNSGKSTLLNSLTGSGELSENRFFSTLDPAVRKLELPGSLPAVLIDTVGFIRDLPHPLIAAFKGTLEEVTSADIIIHVLDVSAPLCEERRKTVLATIEELGAGEKPTVTALNKIDLIGAEDKTRLMNIFEDAVPISAKTGEGLDRLLAVLSEKASVIRKRVRILLPQNRGDLMAKLYEQANVIAAEYTDKAIIVEAEVDENLFNKIKIYMVKK